MPAKHFFLLLLFLTLTQFVCAQSSCKEHLSEAEDKFELGKLYEVTEILSHCVNGNGLSKEEKIRALRLQTLAYLYLDYYEQADEAYLKLLRLDPLHEVNTISDPNELIKHHNKFTTKPIISFHVFTAGLNYCVYNQIVDYSMSGTGSEEKIDDKMGYDFSAGAELNVIGNLQVTVDIGISESKFGFSGKYFDMEDGYYEPSFQQSHTFLELPIGIKYTFSNKKKWEPYVIGGIIPAQLLSARINNISKSVTESGATFSNKVPDITNLKELRINNNLSLFGGAGIRYMVGKNYITFELRYKRGLKNIVDKKHRYDWVQTPSENRRYHFPLNYIDDDFTLNSLSFSIGFVKPMYFPRKIKNKRRSNL